MHWKGVVNYRKGEVPGGAQDSLSRGGGFPGSTTLLCQRVTLLSIGDLGNMCKMLHWHPASKVVLALLPLAPRTGVNPALYL